MDVTRSNFKELLPQIKKSIDEATFLAIDCEFTGLNSDAKISCFDTQKTYFEKIKKGSQNFIIIQFGLCIFTFDEDTEVFKQNCYNFYVFPWQQDRSLPDRQFVCQASSIDFLVENNFDFNKVFRQGITYLNKDEESRCLQYVLERQQMRASKSTPASKNTFSNAPNVTKEDDKKYIDKNLELIDAFMKSEDAEIMLPRCNGFLRKVMYQTVSGRYGDDISLETRIVENKDRMLFAVKSSPERKAEKEKKRCDQEIEDLKDSIGFSVVVQHIAESGKLVIGHNFLLDILHVVDKFMTPVPYDYEDFKECVHCLFPSLLDTKFMGNSFPFKETIYSTVLAHVLEAVSNEPFTIPAIEIDTENGDCGYKLGDEKQHEAGYDAFITGVCFLAMSQYLGKLQKVKHVILPDSKLLKPYINKIHVMKIQDCSYINLAGKDLIPPRDHILHITFPRDWTNSHIMELFSPFGNIYVGWIDDCSAYISLNNRDEASKALISLHGNKTCTVISYLRHTGATEKDTNKSVTEKYTNQIIRDTRKRKLQIDESVPKRVHRTINEQSQENVSTPKTTSAKSKIFAESSTWD